VVGAIIDLFGGTAEVTLRSPPPLAVPMSIDRLGDWVVVRIGGTLVAEVKPSVIDVKVPSCSDTASVARAVERFNEFKKDEFHKSFTCGFGREEGDGRLLLIGPGRRH
jgi:hypothetical protein